MTGHSSFSICGWIALHRRLLHHPRFCEPEWVSVWIYLLLNATHAPRQVIFEGKSVTLRPGQLITGRNVIAKATGVDPSKVYRLLKLLKAEQQIEQQPGKKNSVITVLNWPLYQKTEQQTGQQVNNKSQKSERKMNNKVNSHQGNQSLGKSGQLSLLQVSPEQQNEQQMNSKGPKFEHKQQYIEEGKGKPSVANRITLEKKISILKGRLAHLEDDTADQWQRDQHPELVAEKAKVKADITKLENAILES